MKVACERVDLIDFTLNDDDLSFFLVILWVSILKICHYLFCISVVVTKISWDIYFLTVRINLEAHWESENTLTISNVWLIVWTLFHEFRSQIIMVPVVVEIQYIFEINLFDILEHWLDLSLGSVKCVLQAFHTELASYIESFIPFYLCCW